MTDFSTFDLGDARGVAQKLGLYRNVNFSRSVLELLVTVLPFAALWVAMLEAMAISYWLTLLLAIPTAAFLARLFMIQHDCGHGALFRGRATNDWTGRLIGVATFTPYNCWSRTHAAHHATVGNLERRGLGDIITLTAAEFRALSPMRRLGYRAYRHPIVMFVLAPAYVFLIHNRLPVGLMHSGAQPWLSAMGTNAAIGAVILLMVWLVGIASFLLVEIPVVLIAASIAGWFFYMQHQFDETRWAHDGDWAFHDAVFHGSSYYRLPQPFAWLTGNIGVHHVHHLCSRIPFYRLSKVLVDHPKLATVGRVGFLQSLRFTSLALWDEDRRRLVSFRDQAPARLQTS